MSEFVGLRYSPELDGVRGVAVLLVLLFHLGLPWMSGGYVGVSVFFTLSGYLITRLLLAEADHTGRVVMGRFYARRARRLIPAAQLVLGSVVVARMAGEFDSVAGLRTQMWCALLQVSNWVQLAGTSSYQSLFDGSPLTLSPVAHFWSLAIEEQFYLVWPWVVVGLVRLARRSGSGRAGVRLGSSLVLLLCALWAVCALTAVGIAVRWGGDAAYWATPARLGELVAGAWLAGWQRDRSRAGRGVSERVAWLALPALTAIVVAAATWPDQGGPAFSGWLPLASVVSVALLVSLQVPGHGRRVLSWRPLVWCGRISYGLYLVHWPVILVLRSHGVDVDALPGALVAVALSIGLAHLSAAFVERPLREWEADGRRTSVAALAALAAVAALVAAMPSTRGVLEIDGSTFDAVTIATIGEETLVPLRDTAAVSTHPTSAPPSSTESSGPTSVAAVAPVAPVGPFTLGPAPARPVRILLVGDSTAFALGGGLAEWVATVPGHAALDVRWAQGLGFLLDGSITSFEADSFVARSAELVGEELPVTIAAVQPDVVVLMSTVNDVADRRWDEAEGTLTPHDPAFRRRLLEQYTTVTRSVLSAGAPTVVWVAPVVPTSVFDHDDLNDHSRFDVLHAVIREVSAAAEAWGGGRVVVAELDAWMQARGVADDADWRPDGTHLSAAGARTIAEEWLGPWLVGLATDDGT